MKTQFKELYKVQESVNKVVVERLEENDLELPTTLDFLVAMHVEIFEFFNEVGTWKWWKQNHNTNKEKILDELADVIAFFLSIVVVNKAYQKNLDENIGELLEQIEEYDTDAIIKSVSAGVENGQQQQFIPLMAMCIEVAVKEVDATWEDIQDAYLKKSQVNIDRQKENY